MKREEYRHTIIPPVMEPISPPGKCMRGVLDVELYDRTGEVRMIEELTEYVLPVIDDIEALARRRVIVNVNKPSKERLENDLREGLSIAEISNKYGSKAQTVYYWIRSYGLQGIQGVKNPSGALGLDPVVEVAKVDVPVCGGFDLSKVANLCTCPSDDQEDKPEEHELDDREPLLTDEEIEELSGRPAELSEPEPEPEPQREPYEEVWSDLRDDIVTLRRLHARDADELFFDRLHRLFLEVRG